MREKRQREKGIVGPEAWESSVYVEGKLGWQSWLQALGCDSGSGKTRTDLKDCTKVTREVRAREGFIHSTNTY